MPNWLQSYTFLPMRKETPVWSLAALMMLFGWVVLLTRCEGSEITLAWDAAPEGENVTEWRVYRMNGADRVLLTTVTSPTAVVQADPGNVVGVTAWNGLESQPVTLTIPLPPSPPSTPTGLRVVEIQTSSNLQDWKPLAFVPLQAEGEPTRFVRATITTVSKP